MGLVRIRDVVPLEGFRLRLTLTDGRVIERDVAPLLVGPVFDAIRSNYDLFLQARAEAGTVVWPNGADLCPDVLIWGGPPRQKPPSISRKRLYVSKEISTSRLKVWFSSPTKTNERLLNHLAIRRVKGDLLGATSAFPSALPIWIYRRTKGAKIRRSKILEFASWPVTRVNPP